jgi:phage baseplate assembly protein W
VRDLIEQVLFTSPGERVMRPDFGSGLLAMVFEPGGAEVAAATQYLVRGALERELSDVLTLASVDVEMLDAALVVTVAYVVQRTQAHEVATFRAPGGVP